MDPKISRGQIFKQLGCKAAAMTYIVKGMLMMKYWYVAKIQDEGTKGSDRPQLEPYILAEYAPSHILGTLHAVHSLNLKAAHFTSIFWELLNPSPDMSQKPWQLA